jgi:hypothetical protein
MRSSVFVLSSVQGRKVSERRKCLLERIGTVGVYLVGSSNVDLNGMEVTLDWTPKAAVSNRTEMTGVVVTQTSAW